MGKKTGLEILVENNLTEIVDGFAWILLGKYQSTRGYKKWEMTFVYPENADKYEFADMRRLLENDENAILFNGYECTWVGVDGMGGTDISTKDVAKRLKSAYDSGKYKATHEEIDALMPDEMYRETVKEREKIRNNLEANGWTFENGEWVQPA